MSLTGFQPALSYENWILSPTGLAVSPQRPIKNYISSLMTLPIGLLRLIFNNISYLYYLVKFNSVLYIRKQDVRVTIPELKFWRLV